MLTQLSLKKPIPWQTIIEETETEIITKKVLYTKGNKEDMFVYSEIRKPKEKVLAEITTKIDALKEELSKLEAEKVVYEAKVSDFKIDTNEIIK